MPLTLTDGDLMIIRDALEERNLTESMKSLGMTRYDLSMLTGRILTEIERRDRFEEELKRIDSKTQPNETEHMRYAKGR